MKLISTQFLLLAIFIVISVALAAFAPFIEKKIAFKNSDLPASVLNNETSSSSPGSDAKSTPQTIKIGDTTFKVEIANTYDARARGLSGRKNLAADTGLLFLFDAPARYGFWMKDMNFPIDIIWIGDNGKVVFIEKNVKPDTYPKVFYSSGPANFVLELNAGAVDNHSIKIGTKICQENFLTATEALACA